MYLSLLSFLAVLPTSLPHTQTNMRACVYRHTHMHAGTHARMQTHRHTFFTEGMNTTNVSESASKFQEMNEVPSVHVLHVNTALATSEDSDVVAFLRTADSKSLLLSYL